MPPAPLTDEQLQRLADDPALLAKYESKLNSDERRRLGQFRQLAPPQQPSAMQRFAEPILAAPGDAVNFAVGIATDPFNGFPTTRSVLDASAGQIDKAKQAQNEGRPLAAVGHAFGAVPLVGPAVADIVDTAQSGDFAGAAGKTAVMAAPFAAKPALAGVRAGAGVALETARKSPAVAAGMDRLAGSVDKFAEDRFTRAIAPQVGPNKTRFGGMAAEKAPELLRDPELKSASVGGFDNRLEDAMAKTVDELDAANDARLVSQQVKTQPLIAKLDAEIARLTSQPVEGSRLDKATTVTSKTTGTGFDVGRPTTRPEIVNAEYARIMGKPAPLTGAPANTSASLGSGGPIGNPVVPEPYSAQVATLRKIRAEIQQLGDVVPYEAVRNIRQAWDQVAKAKYMPATAADALKGQGDATGAMKGTGAMREALAEVDPASAAVYKKYSLYKAAQDVRAAAQEAERTRPNRGRGMMRMMASSQGIVGTALAIADKAAEMTPSFQVMVSRRMAAVADMLRKGQVEQAQAVVNRTVAQFPKVKGGLRIVAKNSANFGRVAELGRVAASANDPSEGNP